MLFRKEKTIKVAKNIHPINVKSRRVPELIIGNDYYISFGMNRAKHCRLLEIIQHSKESHQKVSIGIKDNSGMGYGNVHIVYSDEIGTSPEEAVINTVTM